MVNSTEIKNSFNKQYKNGKTGKNFSINKQLLIDYKIFCEDLSRRSVKKISVSSRVRLLMYKDLIDNGRLKIIND